MLLHDNPDLSDMADSKVEDSIFQFSAKFCRAQSKFKNCVFSPLVAAEITISTNALRETCHSGNMFRNTVQSSSDKNIPSTSNLLSPKFKLLKRSTLKRASKVYLNKEHYRVDPKQKKDIRQLFNVKVKNIDFTNDTAAEIINMWVAEKTNGKIICFIKDNEFELDTHIILVSGLYFKGFWRIKFDPNKTEETIFYLNNNEIVNVFMMNRTANYKYKDNPDLDAQLLLIPFKKEEAHMLIILPKRITGLDRVLQKLADGYDLMAEVGKISHYVEVDVRIPRFKIESEINVVKVLSKLGITTIFDKAVQKVLIDVNEEGAEPKTEKLKGGTLIPRWKPKPIDFTADRPHLVIILCDNIPIVWVTFRGKFE